MLREIYIPGEAVSGADEGDRHGCCCEHVVDSLIAMPAAEEERAAVARDKYYSCPHTDLTPLQEYMESAR